MEPSILKAVSPDIDLPVAMIFRNSVWTRVSSSGTGEQLMSHRFLRNGTNVNWVNLIIVQYGLRKGYSCTTNLLVFLEKVTVDVDAKRNVDTIYLDL